jgi:Probable zinc-ribbon domain
MASFAIKQEIGMVQEQLLKADNEKDKVKLQTRLTDLQQQRDSADAALAAKKAVEIASAASAANKAAKKAWGPVAAAGATATGEKHQQAPRGKTLQCYDCNVMFFFSDKEQDFYKQKGLKEPGRCSQCRAERKAQKLAAMHIECKDCKKHFVFTAEAQEHFSASGFDAPIRCSSCRVTKKAQPKLVAYPINCTDCKTDFTFPVGSQIFFKEKGWNAPTRCTECRKTNKVKVAAAAATSDIKPEDVIAAASVMVNGDGSFNVGANEEPKE